jgi:thiamine-phosphate pyrophosphorylase
MSDQHTRAATPARSGAERRALLAAARLYLVCDARPGGRELTSVIAAAVAGGVGVVQLRDKHTPPEQLTGVATSARLLCERLGALFIVNDHPRLALEAGADGVHVGQDDVPAPEARELVGADMLVGLSTHSPAQIDAVDAAPVDYIGVGPIHETPTKPGRPAVGLKLISYAATRARVPFFAIGGLHAGNVADALAAGASRVCVLRAIADAEQPERAARALREQLDARAPRTGTQAALR